MSQNVQKPLQTPEQNAIQSHTASASQGRSAFSTVAIIGYGRFGKLWAELWAMQADKILIYDKNPALCTASNIENSSTSLQLHSSSLAELASADLVFYCVPISALRNSLEETRAHLSPHSVVCDICSVKVQPVQWMHALLPANQSIVGTHPLFGPDSFCNTAIANIDTHVSQLSPQSVPQSVPQSLSKSVQQAKEEAQATTATYSSTAPKNNLVVDRVNISDAHFDELLSKFSAMGITVHRMSAQEHDRQAIYSQGLTHLVGRVLNKLPLSASVVSTKGYESLLEIIQQTCNDSEQLFYDIQNYNEESSAMWNTLSKALDGTIKEIRDKTLH